MNIKDETVGYELYMYGGDDTADYSSLNDNTIAIEITYDIFNSGLIIDKGGISSDSISQIENIIGTVNDDVMNGTADMTNLNFDGSGGSDTVSYAEDQDGIQVQLDDATTTIDKGGKDTNGDVVPDEFSGQDTITNVETLRGSSGNDVFVMSGAGSSSSTMAIDGGSGTDFLSFRKYSTALSGDLSAITVTGYVATGFESIEGTVYDDTVSVTTDGSVDSNNVGFVGGEGNDTITFDSSGSGNWSISVDLYNNTATRSTGGSFTIGSVEVFSLTDQNDSVRLSQEAFDNNYQIDGGAGADTVDFQSLDVADSEVVINADNIAVDGVETIKNFENYVFDVVENLHWNATGVDASEYSIEALGGGLYFDISNIIVSRQTMSFSSSNFTNSVYFSSTIDEFHFSGGNNTFMATNLEDVTVVGSSDTTAVDVLSLEYVTSGVNLVTTSGSSGGAAGTISRNGQVTETFSDINEIILTSYSDSLTLTEFLVTGDKILVDGGAGVDSVAIAAAGGSGVDVDLGSGGGGSGGSSTYEIINVENTSLSDFNDTVYSVVDGDFDLDGKDGIDTIDYTTRDNIIVNLQVSESAGVVQATAQKYDSASSDPSLVMGRDFLSSFEIYQLGEHDDVVSITTTLTQDVEIYGNGGINEFYYLGTDISASGAIDMSVSGTGDFTVGSLSVYNFQEIYLRTIKKINFNLNLDVADGFQLFLSDAADASYTFNFSSSSMIVFDNVDHSFSNDDGMFFLETYVHSLDFGASDVTLKIGIDQTFQNMSFSSSGMIYIELQDSLISSMNLEIDGDSGSPHASLQLNSSYNYEITSVFTMDITTSAKIAIADSAANTAYIITSDPSVLNPNNVNYTFEYGTNMSGLILEDKQNAIMYGAMTLALGNSNIDVTTTGEVNFKFGSDMDSSSYEFRRYNISSGSSFASFNLSADGTSDYVTNSREFEVVINAVSSSGSYTLDIYDVSTGEKDLQFIINNANAFSFSAGSSQDIEIGGDVNNFTLNEGFDFGSGGILNYAVTGAMGTDVVLSYSDGTWSDVLRNNYISFYGDFYFDASSLADDVLTINEEWDTLSRVNVNILGLDGKDIQLDIDQSGVAVVLSIGDDGITLTETGGSSTTFSFDTASVEDIAISTGNLAEIEIYDAFLNNLGNNITIHQENATNIVFSGSSGVEQYYFDISASANGVSLVNSSGSEMNFESDLGVSSITFDNPELIFDLNLVGDQFGDSSGDETLYLEGVGELSSLTLDTGAYIWFTQSDASHSLQVKYNRGEADESVVSVFGALWFRNDLQMDIVLSDEPDELVFSRVAIMSEELSSIDVGDDDLSTEDTVHIDYTIDGTSFLEVKVTSDFTTTLSRRGTGSNPMEIDQFGVINSFTTGLGGTSKNEFIYIFAAIPDAGVGDLEYAVNSVEHLDNTSSQPRAKAEFIDIQDVGAMSITIAIDSSSSKGDYVDTVTDRDGSKSNIIVKNASIFSLSSNMDTGTNNSVSQGDLEHDYVFNNTMSLSALDYSYTFSGSIEVIGNLVIKKDGSGVEQGRDMVVGDINSIRAIYHNSFNIDLSSQAAATTIVMYGDEFAFTDVRATGYSDTLVISNEIYEGFSGSDKYAVFDMAGGDDVLLIDDINNDLYIGNSVSSFRNLDVQNAMSIEEGGKGIFVNSVENISFDTRYADVHIGAYARGFNFVAEENTTVFIESEKMDASFEFINGGVISFEDLDSQSLVFSADNDNYSFNGENLAVEGEFDLVGTKGDDVFEINGDNISDLQSIDGLEGTDTLNISGNIRSASEFSGKVTNISRLVFNDMDTNSIDLSIEDIINIKGNQEELLIDVQDSDFNVNIVGDNSDYSYALVKNGEYMTYSLFDANSKEMGTVMVNDGAGLNEDGIYMQGSTMSDELTITSEELREAVSIDGSDGFDTLEISGSITGMEGVAGKTQNIEKIVISDVEETSANLSIKDAISMTDDKNQLVIDIEDEDFDLNIINDGSDYSYSVKSDGEHDVYTVYSDENQNDEVGQIIVNHNHNNGNHH